MRFGAALGACRRLFPIGAGLLPGAARAMLTVPMQTMLGAMQAIDIFAIPILRYNHISHNILDFISARWLHERPEILARRRSQIS